MKDQILILFFLIVCHFSTVVAQNLGTTVKRGKPPVGVAKAKSTPVSVRTGTVSIISDQACTFLIDGKSYGSLDAGQVKTLSMTFGNHKLSATAVTTSYTFSEGFSISGKSAAVRIDFARIAQAIQRKLDSLNALSVQKSDPPKAPPVVNQTTVPVVQASTEVKKAPETKAPVSNVNAKKISKAMLANMVTVSANTFTMGSNLGANDELPEHTVNIKAVQFSKYEVTQGQWTTIMTSNPSRNFDCDSCPVENISWEDARTFIRKLNEAGTTNFRLPTEAEWEFVARSGGGKSDLVLRAWYKSNSEQHTHPVGTQGPNDLGLYDISGNVAEWCSDWYGLSYYKTKAGNNPTGPETGKFKVVRGGSFEDGEAILRPSFRDKQTPVSTRGTTGLRLVMDAK